MASLQSVDWETAVVDRTKATPATRQFVSMETLASLLWVRRALPPAGPATEFDRTSGPTDRLVQISFFRPPDWTAREALSSPATKAGAPYLTTLFVGRCGKFHCSLPATLGNSIDLRGIKVKFRELPTFPHKSVVRYPESCTLPQPVPRVRLSKKKQVLASCLARQDGP
jgi:hypothetical protein